MDENKTPSTEEEVKSKADEIVKKIKALVKEGNVASAEEPWNNESSDKIHKGPCLFLKPPPRFPQTFTDPPFVRQIDPV